MSLLHRLLPIFTLCALLLSGGSQTGCLFEQRGATLADSVAANADTAADLGPEGLVVEEDTLESDGAIRSLIAQRKTAGNTSVLNVAQLNAFVLTGFENFRVEGTTSEVVDVSGVRMGILGYRLTNGSQSIKVDLRDLNGNPENLAAAWRVHSRSASYQTQTERHDAWTARPGVVGYEKIEPRAGKATVSLLVGNRFTLALSGTGFQNTATLKKAVLAMKLDEMVALGDE
jgi:hypothetical protein